mgnify:CR=1 FL=1
MKEVELLYPGINACYGFISDTLKQKPTKIEALQETIYMYAEALEAMTKQRNIWEAVAISACDRADRAEQKANEWRCRYDLLAAEAVRVRNK